jgi:galactokinase
VPDKLIVSAPGRICLFGEHQDYLGLPVIPAAISLRLTIEGTRRNDAKVHLRLPDVNRTEAFSLPGPLSYTHQKDYFRSVVNVLHKHGFACSAGVDAIVRSSIPIQAGTSSSSALSVAWTAFLSALNGHDIALSQIGRYAYEAEVVEFNEAGGMMDQYTASLGGVLAIAFVPHVRVEPLAGGLGAFVLGDSKEPKDTQAILSRVKNGVMQIVAQLSDTDDSFTLRAATPETIKRYQLMLDPSQYELLAGTVLNHTITQEARRCMGAEMVDHRQVGALMNSHQIVLRDFLNVSTPKIDRMLEAALRSGAYGGKINGSGGGGCMVAYAPENPELVAEAIEREGGKAYIARVDQGVMVESTL